MSRYCIKKIDNGNKNCIIYARCHYNHINLFYPPSSNPDVTGHATVPILGGTALVKSLAANVASIEFTAQLLLVDLHYFFTERLFCECCGMRLRASPTKRIQGKS
jgi:hypothetical protein